MIIVLICTIDLFSLWSNAWLGHMFMFIFLECTDVFDRHDDSKVVGMTPMFGTSPHTEASCIEKCVDLSSLCVGTMLESDICHIVSGFYDPYDMEPNTKFNTYVRVQCTSGK